MNTVKIYTPSNDDIIVARFYIKLLKHLASSDMCTHQAPMVSDLLDDEIPMTIFDFSDFVTQEMKDKLKAYLVPHYKPFSTINKFPTKF